MYISLHRFENGRFYPHNRDADLDAVGGPGAEGRNVNIPWPTDGMCDGDYLHAFQRVILPIAYEFDPQLVFGTRRLRRGIAAGWLWREPDAARSPVVRFVWQLPRALTRRPATRSADATFRRRATRT